MQCDSQKLLLPVTLHELEVLTVTKEEADTDSVFEKRPRDRRVPSFSTPTKTPTTTMTPGYLLTSGRSALAAHRRSEGSIGSISNLSSPLVSLLGEEKFRRYSEYHARAKSLAPSERCFYFLLFLVTFIYAVGIFSAIVLLFFHRWFFD